MTLLRRRTIKEGDPSWLLLPLLSDGTTLARLDAVIRVNDCRRLTDCLGSGGSPPPPPLLLLLLLWLLDCEGRRNIMLENRLFAPSATVMDFRR